MYIKSSLEKMKKSRIIVNLMVALSALLFLGSCARMEEPDYRDLDYGHVQFKLYKAASYEPVSKAEISTRAQNKPRLDSLYEARKIQLYLTYEDGQKIVQTLVFLPASVETADYGLRSDNLKLLAGKYTITSYELYDKDDEPLYKNKSNDYLGDNNQFTIVAGGLCVHDLTSQTRERGKVRFTLVKDLSQMPQTRGVESAREYTFDEAKSIDVTVFNRNNSRTFSFEKLPVEFGMHFEDEDSEVNPDWQTSSSICDTLLVLDAGEYEIKEIKVYDGTGKNAKLIETQYETETFKSEGYRFTVSDNKLTKADLPLTLKGTAEYISDYIALKEIWESLNGPKWSYVGENFTKGANWNFEKDIDLWGDQPGVKLHNNGRVALIDISEFGFSGPIPEAIGDLTELVELYLGTHNDNNLHYSQVNGEPDPTVYNPTMAVGDINKNLMERHREYLRNIHTLTQLSGPSAFALKEKGRYIPEIKLYKKYTEEQIFDAKGRQRQIQPMDMNHGTLCNGLTGIDGAIGNCKKLETIYIANGEISSLPKEFGDLESLATLELYNCSKLEVNDDMITAFRKMKSLDFVNMANNGQWNADECKRIIDAFGESPSAESISIFYFRQNKLEKMDFTKFKKLGLLDLAFNNINEVVPFGPKVSIEQIFLSNNQITSIPDGFCGTDGVETLSFSNNRITEFPNSFSAKAAYIMGSLDLSYNQISSFPADFKGISVNSLSLVENNLTEFPKELFKSNSYVGTLNLRGNKIADFPEEALEYDYREPGANIPPDVENGEWEEYDPTYSNMALLSVLDLSYNRLSDLPENFSALKLPNLQSIDLSNNNFSKFPFEPFYCSSLVVYAIRNQAYPEGHAKAGKRSLKEWPYNYGSHAGIRGLFLGGNDIGVVDDNISYLCYNLEISDNPNIVFDATDICDYWKAGMFVLMYDKTQNIINCDAMLE